MSTERRFAIGDRVLARTYGWHAGTITELDYRETHWNPDEISPYQILLDSTCRLEENYVHAPHDCDTFVRAIPKYANDFNEILGGCTGCPDCVSDNAPTCDNSGTSCPLFHTCDDSVECRKWHFCGKQGRRVTRLRRKILERQGLKSRRENLCHHCWNGDCQDVCEASLDDLLAFVEGTANRATTAQGEATKNNRKGKKKTRASAKQHGKLPQKQTCTSARSSSDHTKEVNTSTRRAVLGERSDTQQPSLKLAPSESTINVPCGGHEAGACDCDCHAVAAQGRDAVRVKLLEGMDFSSLFIAEQFETADMTTEFEKELALFERKLRTDYCFSPKWPSGDEFGIQVPGCSSIIHAR